MRNWKRLEQNFKKDIHLQATVSFNEELKEAWTLKEKVKVFKTVSFNEELKAFEH